MNQMLTIAITTIIVFCVQEYRHRVIKPIRYEQKPALMESWQDFITANINSCFTQEHCFQCHELINLFIIKFAQDIPSPLFKRDIENILNRLDTKYKAIKHQDNLSDITVDTLIN